MTVTDTATSTGFETLREALCRSIGQEKAHRDTPQGFYEQERFQQRPGLSDRYPPLESDLRWIESEARWL